LHFLGPCGVGCPFAVVGCPLPMPTDQVDGLVVSKLVVSKDPSRGVAATANRSPNKRAAKRPPCTTDHSPLTTHKLTPRKRQPSRLCGKCRLARRALQPTTDFGQVSPAFSSPAAQSEAISQEGWTGGVHAGRSGKICRVSGWRSNQNSLYTICADFQILFTQILQNMFFCDASLSGPST
jgi:hypothetical protein